MKKTIVFAFLAGVIVAGGLAPFAMSLDIFQAIGLSIVITATSAFLALVLIALGFVGFVGWQIALTHLEDIWDVLKARGIVKEREA
jgi:hypothetical protein